MKLPLHEYILTVTLSIALALLIVRLFTARLVRVYKFFFCYLIVDVLDTVYPFFIRFGDLYGYVYISLQCIKLCLYVLIVFELYSVLLRDLKGIARMAKRYSVVALVISVMISAFVVMELPLPHRLLRKLFYIEIPIISILVLFLLLIAMYLIYYPVPLPRNAVVYTTGYFVYFISKTALLVLINLHQTASVRTFSTILLYVGLGCIVYWTISLSRAGEEREVLVGSSWSLPERQQQVLDHLRELNDIMLGSGPR
jgi:hypothetical protein